MIGSGVVGQATFFGLTAKGHKGTFCDINPEILDQLASNGHSVCLPGSLDQVAGVEAFFLTVSTPTVDGRIQLGFLEAAVANLGEVLKNNTSYPIVVVRSTVPPGTTRELLIPLLEKHSGKKAGEGFGVCMNPEYLRENSNKEDFQHPWLVTIGSLDVKSGQVLADIYGPQEQKCPIFHLSLEEAEIQKYIHNLYNASKISFFNEKRRVCEKMGIDADVVFPIVMVSAEAQWNPQYGIRDFGPFGGSCLPKDTSAFLAWAKDRLGLSLPLLKAVIKVNEVVKDSRNNGNGNGH